VSLASLLFLIATALAGAAVVLRVRHRLAASLRKLERQAATLAEQAELLDLAHDAILVWDLRSGEIRFWNRGAEEVYGWRRDEVLGRTPQAVLNTQFPQPLAEINADLVRDKRWEGELVHTRRDGTAWSSLAAGRCNSIALVSQALCSASTATSPIASVPRPRSSTRHSTTP